MELNLENMISGKMLDTIVLSYAQTACKDGEKKGFAVSAIPAIVHTIDVGGPSGLGSEKQIS